MVITNQNVFIVASARSLAFCIVPAQSSRNLVRHFQRTRELKPHISPVISTIPALSSFLSCEVSPTGGGGYMVFPNNNRRHYNVVKLVFSNDPTVQHVYSCTCGWCSRWLIPCRHVIAAAKGARSTASVLAVICCAIGFGVICVHLAGKFHTRRSACETRLERLSYPRVIFLACKKLLSACPSALRLDHFLVHAGGQACPDREVCNHGML